MALCKIRSYHALAKHFPKPERHTARSYSTAATTVASLGGTSEHARAFRLYTKSHIASLFQRYAPSLDPVAYLAAAQVFPMRANNYVLEDLIDWFVSSLLSVSHGRQHGLNFFESRGTYGIICPEDYSRYSATIVVYDAHAKVFANTSGRTYQQIRCFNLSFLNQQCSRKETSGL